MFTYLLTDRTASTVRERRATGVSFEAENRMLKKEIAMLREQLKRYKERCGDIEG